jgi:hypothetical protein
MTIGGWLQIGIFCLALLAVTKPMGLYVECVYDGRMHWLRPVENAIMGRVRTRHPRVGRRPLGRHRRHAGALGLAGDPHHLQPGRDLHRPHDRACGGRRSIVVLARERFGMRGRPVHEDGAHPAARFVAFSAAARMSGVNVGGLELRKAAGDSVARRVREGGPVDSGPSEGTSPLRWDAHIDRELDRLADAVEAALDFTASDRLVGLSSTVGA